MLINREEECNSEKFAEFLKDVVNKVKLEEDPVFLSSLKKEFKKNVPFTLRMYVAAYLAKQASALSGDSRSYGKNSYHTKNKKRFNDEESTRLPRISIDESQASSIFISIGRNRRVYPRDLIALVSGVAGIDRERIGEIRVLDNYSFVQLFTEDTEKTIKKLDGYEYRGRKLSVSYSRKKDECDDMSGSADITDDTHPIDEDNHSDENI